VTEPFPPHLEDVADHLYVIFCTKLPYCGCGNPEDGYRLIQQLLALAPLYANDHWRKARELCGSDGAHQLILAALTDADLMEHGGSIGGSWLTDRGRWVLWAVEQIGGIEALETLLDTGADRSAPAPGAPHYDPETKQMQDCTDACWTIPATPEGADQ
jgi:hypothetical protein